MLELVAAFRRLRRRPFFTLAVVVVLALGIALSTATFTLVETVLLRPLPFERPDELVRIEEHRKADPSFVVETSRPFLKLWQRELSTLDVAAYATSSGRAPVDLDGAGPLDTERIGARIVTGTFFEVLGVDPLLGRLLDEDDDRIGAPPVAVVREDLWRERLGAGIDVLGRQIRVSGVDRTIVGVVPADIDYPVGTRVWTPVATSAQEELLGNWAIAFLQPIGRLRGVSREAASSQLQGLVDREMNPLRPPAQATSVTFEPLADRVRRDSRSWLGLMLASGLLVLAVACVNVAGLELARAVDRVDDLSVLRALGAERRTIAWSLVAEVLLLAAPATLVGMWLARLLVARLAVAGDLQGPLQMFRLAGAELSSVGLLFATFSGAASVAIGGLLPMLGLSGRWMRAPGDRRSGPSAGHQALGATAVVAQLALATVLLLSAALVGESLRSQRAVETGFDGPGLLTASMPLQGERFEEAEANHAVFDRVRREVASIPGVEAVGGMLIRPLEGPDGFDYPIHLEGREDEYADNPPVNYQTVTPGAIEALSLELLAGRSLREADAPDAPPVAVVSRSFVERFLPDEDPIGRRFRLGPPEWEGPWLRIVGVVEDARLRGLESPRLEIYVPHAQSPWPLGHLLVRGHDPRALLPQVEATLRRIDPELFLLDAVTGSGLVERWLERPRFFGGTLAGFAGLGLLLAAVGLYALMAYTVTRRGRELAIRSALGARPLVLARETFGVSARRAVLGVGLGASAFAAAQGALAGRLDQMLLGVRLGWSATALLGASLLVVAAVSVITPSIRAARQQPSRLLRS